MFGLLGGLFSVGQSLAGTKAPKYAQQVTNAENAFNTKVSKINARREARDNSYALGAQRVQAAAGGNSQYGSMLFTFADDARKAREKVTNIHLENSQRILGNQAGGPSQSQANTQAFGTAFRFGANLYKTGLL